MYWDKKKLDKNSLLQKQCDFSHVLNNEIASVFSSYSNSKSLFLHFSDSYLSENHYVINIIQQLAEALKYDLYLIYNGKKSNFKCLDNFCKQMISCSSTRIIDKTINSVDVKSILYFGNPSNNFLTFINDYNLSSVFLVDYLFENSFFTLSKFEEWSINNYKIVVNSKNLGKCLKDKYGVPSKYIKYISYWDKVKKGSYSNTVLMDFVFLLSEYLGNKFAKVSVAVPNYNYAKYLDSRILSIVFQTYPLYEVLLLDDCSTDDSIEKFSMYKSKNPYLFNVICNNTNSGNVFFQWKKAFANSRGDYVWIAEADDIAHPFLLESLVNSFISNDEILLAYSQSARINTGGNFISKNSLSNTDDIDTLRWRSNYINDACDELKKYFSIKNIIPNVSAVLFKNVNYSSYLTEASKFKVAGDWYFYYSVLKKGGKISYICEPLNYHRIHDRSVTKKLNWVEHFNEICYVQDIIMDTMNVELFQREIVYNYRKKIKAVLTW